MFSPRLWFGACRFNVANYCLVWMVLQFAIPTVVRADKALDEFNRAAALYRQARWFPAAERFRGFLKTNEKHDKAPLARLYLGLSLLNEENFLAARDELRRFAKDYPQDQNLPQVKYRIAECSYLLEDWSVARTELDAFVNDFPQDPFQERALPYLGDTQLRLNDYAGAQTTLQQAVDRYPNGALIDDASYGLARSLAGLKRDEEAIARFQALAAKKDSPHAVDAQFQLGLLAFERKKFAEAAAAYIDLTRLFPTSPLVPAAHLNAGYAYYQSGKFAQAAIQFDAAIVEESQKATAGYWLGMSLKSLALHAKAIPVFQAAAAIAGDEPIAEAIVYQQALCERQLGKTVEAKQSFETVLNRWPTGESAADSLCALADMAIEAGDLEAADAMLARFAQAYPESRLRTNMELLGGRLELSRAALLRRNNKPAEQLSPHYEAAARRFLKAMSEGPRAGTNGHARYYLALTRQLQGQHAQALEIIETVVEDVYVRGAKSELIDSLVLKAESLQAEKKFRDAETTAAVYLELQPQPRQAARAISIQTVSAFQRGDQAKAEVYLERMNREFPADAVRVSTIQQLAEAASKREDWSAAARFYEVLVPLTTNTDAQPATLFGLALAQHKKQDFEQAARTFEQIIKEFPQNGLVTESRYYRGETLRDTGKIEEAIVAFDELMRMIPADMPPAPGSELRPPTLYSYRAGLQAARLLVKAKRINEADTVYEEFTKRFPKQQRMDAILDEWATLNYEAQRFERSDAIFRRLLKEFPDTEFADNALWNLAESDVRTNRLDRAKKLYDELMMSPTAKPELKERALCQLVALAVNQQRWADVEELATKLVSEYPKNSHRTYAVYALVEVDLANRNATPAELEDAKNVLKELLKMQDHPEIRASDWYDRTWVLLAEIALREANYDELETIVGELRQRGVKSRHLYQAEEVLGRGFAKQATKQDEAIKIFQRILNDPLAEQTETAARSQFQIGDIYLNQKKWDDAGLAYQKVYTNFKFPALRSAALMQLAKCDEHRGMLKDAIATYRRLIDEFPDSIDAQDARVRLSMISSTQ